MSTTAENVQTDQLVEKLNGRLDELISKRLDEMLPKKLEEIESSKTPSMTIIATKGTLDWAYPPFILNPERLGITPAPLGALVVHDRDESLMRIREVLEDRPGPARDIVALNAGAALYVAGVASGLEAGVREACTALRSGRAAAVLDRLVAFGRPAG